MGEVSDVLVCLQSGDYPIVAVPGLRDNGDKGCQDIQPPNDARECEPLMASRAPERPELVVDFCYESWDYPQNFQFKESDLCGKSSKVL
jgi:hypothetical protein